MPRRLVVPPIGVAFVLVTLQAKGVAAEWVLPTLPCALDPAAAIVVEAMNPADLILTNQPWNTWETKTQYIRGDRALLEEIMISLGPTCARSGMTQCPDIESRRYHTTIAQTLCFDAYEIRELRAEIMIGSLPSADAALGRASGEKIAAENLRDAYASEPPALRQYEETVNSVNAITQAHIASLGCARESASTSCGRARLAFFMKIMEQAVRRYCASGDRTLRGHGFCQQTQ
jgi:hypothetical protein